jgi:hypothetical protein
MVEFAGSFSGQAESQTTMSVADAPGHQFGLIKIVGSQQSADKAFDQAKITYWAVLEISGASGTQRGYFQNVHANGDLTNGTFESTVSIRDNRVALSGTWRFSGGTGAFAGVSGSGEFQGRMTSPTHVEVTWSGSYSGTA